MTSIQSSFVMNIRRLLWAVNLLGPLCFFSLAEASPAIEIGNAAEVEALGDRLGERFEVALEHYEHGRYHKASAAFDALEAEMLPAGPSAFAHYYMGRSLDAIGLSALAAEELLDVIRLGPHAWAGYDSALDAWLELSLRLDQTREVVDRAARIAPRDGTQPRPVLAYCRALDAFERGRHGEAERILRRMVKARTLLDRQAGYLQAVLEHFHGSDEEAIDTLEALTDGMPSDVYPESARWRRELAERIQQNAALSIARIRYARNEFDAADAWYGRIDGQTFAAVRADYEQAWIALRRDQLDDALHVLAPYRLELQAGMDSPHLVPEAELLAARVYLRSGQYDLADGVLRAWLEDLEPLVAAMRAFQEHFQAEERLGDLVRLLFDVRHEPPRPVADDQADDSMVDAAREEPDDATPRRASGFSAPHERLETYFQGKSGWMIPVLPAILRRDREIDQTLRRLERLREERARLRKQPRWWRESAVAAHLETKAADVEAELLLELGLRTRLILTRTRVWLDEQRLLGIALRREVTKERLIAGTSESMADGYQGPSLTPIEFIHPRTPQ